MRWVTLEICLPWCLLSHGTYKVTVEYGISRSRLKQTVPENEAFRQSMKKSVLMRIWLPAISAIARRLRLFLSARGMPTQFVHWCVRHHPQPSLIAAGVHIAKRGGNSKRVFCWERLVIYASRRFWYGPLQPLHWYVWTDNLTQEGDRVTPAQNVEV